MALLGASGCGKSVTLRCIAGIMTPDSGRIVLDGETLFDSEKHIDLTPQQLRVGYLFQQYALFPNMTVAQNIQCGIRTGSRAEKQTQAAAQIRRFRLEGLEKKYPVQLSGGQQQRVALARILASEPRVILLDEPFSALDTFLKWNLELELADLLADFPGPILWVSHDLGECYRNCKTVCVMENGRSGAVTDMQALVLHPATQDVARLAGCRNFLPAHRCAEGIQLDGWALTLPLQAETEQVTIAVPDSAVTLHTGPYSAVVSRVIRVDRPPAPGASEHPAAPYRAAQERARRTGSDPSALTSARKHASATRPSRHEQPLSNNQSKQKPPLAVHSATGAAWRFQDTKWSLLYVSLPTC